MKRQVKIIILKIFDFVFMLAPLAAILIFNRKQYFYSYQGYKLSFGCILSLVFMLLLMKRKIKLNAFWWCLIVTVIVYFLESILKDAVIICAAGTIGAGFDTLVFSPIIVKQEKIRELEFKANVNATALRTAFAPTSLLDDADEEGNV